MKQEKKNKQIISNFQKKLADNLIENKEIFLKHIKDDWDTIEKGAHREKLFREVKEAALVSAKTILRLAAVGGICSVVLVAPKIFAIASSSGKYKKYYNKQGSLQKFHYLKRQKYIAFKKIDKDYYEINITNKGLAVVLEDSFNLKALYCDKKWDGKWRIVIFDIPEKFKSSREIFRKKLIEIGFYKAQDSVFITPFPCEKEVIFLSEIFNIADFIYFMETSYFVNDKSIRLYFNI